MTPETARAAVILLAAAAARAAVIAGVVGAVLAVGRVRSAAIRSSTWTFVLYAALAMPVLTLALPAWRVPVPVVSEPAPAPLTVSASVAPVAAATPVSTPLSTARMSAATPARAPRPAPPVIDPILLAIELAGCVAFAGWASVGLLATRRLVRGAHAVDPREDAAMHERLGHHALRLGVRRVPALLESVDAVVPMTVGILAPAIVLPRVWRAWPDEELDAVLAHELAHVARGDVRTQRLALVYRGVFWWHPLAWWLNRRLQDLAEQASDDAALATGIAPASYAEALLGFFARASGARGRAAWHVAMARGPVNRAERRLTRILDWSGGSVMTRPSIVSASALVVGLLTLGFASVRPVAAPLGVQLPAVPAPPAERAWPSTVAAPHVAASMVQTSGSAPAEPPTMTPVPAAPADTIGPTDPNAPAQIDAVTPSPVTGQIGFQLPYHPGNGVTTPVLLKQVRPLYTADAMGAKIQGVVTLEVIVEPDGTVGPIRVVRSLDDKLGLDAEAMKAAQQWLFRPALKDGSPVPVLVTIEMEFTQRQRTGAQPSSVAPAPDAAGQAAARLVEARDALSSQAAEFGRGAYRPDDAGVTPPVVAKKVGANYTADAMRAKIQGSVGVEVVVDSDGTVREARVVRSLDTTYGLDESALKAARQWTFTPGTKDGQPVPVICAIDIEFRLH